MSDDELRSAERQSQGEDPEAERSWLLARVRTGQRLAWPELTRLESCEPEAAQSYLREQFDDEVLALAARFGSATAARVSGTSLADQPPALERGEVVLGPAKAGLAYLLAILCELEVWQRANCPSLPGLARVGAALEALGRWLVDPDDVAAPEWEQAMELLRLQRVLHGQASTYVEGRAAQALSRAAGVLTRDREREALDAYSVCEALEGVVYLEHPRLRAWDERYAETRRQTVAPFEAAGAKGLVRWLLAGEPPGRATRPG